MEATVESAPAYTLRNYSNAGVVTLILRFTPIYRRKTRPSEE